jgi:hypothetical protein
MHRSLPSKRVSSAVLATDKFTEQFLRPVSRQITFFVLFIHFIKYVVSNSNSLWLLPIISYNSRNVKSIAIAVTGRGGL